MCSLIRTLVLGTLLVAVSARADYAIKIPAVSYSTTTVTGTAIDSTSAGALGIKAATGATYYSSGSTNITALSETTNGELALAYTLKQTTADVAYSSSTGIILPIDRSFSVRDLHKATKITFQARAATVGLPLQVRVESLKYSSVISAVSGALTSGVSTLDTAYATYTVNIPSDLSFPSWVETNCAAKDTSGTCDSLLSVNGWWNHVTSGDTVNIGQYVRNLNFQPNLDKAWNSGTSLKSNAATVNTLYIKNVKFLGATSYSVSFDSATTASTYTVKNAKDDKFLDTLLVSGATSSACNSSAVWFTSKDTTIAKRLGINSVCKVKDSVKQSDSTWSYSIYYVDTVKVLKAGIDTIWAGIWTSADSAATYQILTVDSLNLTRLKYLPDLKVPLGAPARSYYLGDYFSHATSYSAFSNLDVPYVSVSTPGDDSLHLNFDPGVAGAIDTITVIADKAEAGSITLYDTFTVTFPTIKLVKPIPELEVAEDTTGIAKIDLSTYLSSTKGDALGFFASSEDTTRLKVSVVGSKLNITLVSNANGKATVDVDAFNADGDTAKTSFLVSVAPRDDAPTVKSAIGSITTREDSTISKLNLSGVFADVDSGDHLKYAVASSNTNKLKVSLVSTGDSIQFTLPANANGTATVTVTATDDSGKTVQTSFAVLILPKNDTPTVASRIRTIVVRNDSTISKKALSGVFADVDSGDHLKYTVSSSDANKLGVSLAPTGDSIQFALVSGATGIDTVGVTAIDDSGAIAKTKFLVAILPASITTKEDSSIADLPLYGADSTLSYTVSSTDTSKLKVSLKTTTVGGVDTVKFVLVANANGNASLVVTAKDSSGTTTTTKVPVAIQSVDDAPTNAAFGDALTVSNGDTLILNLNKYFSDVDSGDKLTYASSAYTGYAKVVNATVVHDTLLYLIAKKSNTTAYFTVKATDDSGKVDSVVKVKLTITAAVPKASTVFSAIATAEDSTISSLSVRGHFADVDTSIHLHYTVTSSDTSRLAVHVDSTSTSKDTLLTFALKKDSSGTATVTVTATDANNVSASQSFVVTIAPRDDAPMVKSAIAAIATAEDSTISNLSLSGVFTDVDAGDHLKYSVASSNAGKLKVSLVSTGDSIQFTLPPDSNGAVTVTVTATDDSGKTAQTSFVVTIASREDAPTVKSAIALITTVEDSTISNLSLSGVFTDMDAGDHLKYSVTSSDTNKLKVSVANNSIAFTLVSNANGTATVTVTATDDSGRTVQTSFVVTIASREDAPTVKSAIALITTKEDSVISNVSLSGVFADADAGDHLKYAVSSSDTSKLKVSLVDSSIAFTLVPNANGTVLVTLTATDDSGKTARTSFGVTIAAVNNAPTVKSAIAAIATVEDSTISNLSLSGVFADVDAGDHLAYAVSSSDTSKLKVSLVDNSIAFTLVPNANGTATVTVTATDDSGASAKTSFVVTIAPVNDAPTVKAAIPDQGVFSDASIDPIELSSHFSDVDGDALKYTVMGTNSALATPSISGSKLGLVLSAGVVGTDTLRVTATDPSGASASTKFVLTVEHSAALVSHPGKKIASKELGASIGRSFAEVSHGRGQASIGTGGSSEDLAVEILLPDAAHVEVSIFDNLGTPVISYGIDVSSFDLANLDATGDGRWILPVRWNGRSSDGTAVQAGVYLWKIVAKTEDGGKLETVKKLGIKNGL